MYNKCVNLRIRTKKGIKYFYCTRRKAEIERKECSECNCMEFKKVAKMTSKKPIKAISKKREFVSKKTYEIVFERCMGMCAICGTNQNLHLHHIDGRGKGKTDNPDNCIILCNYCHLEVVHKNNKYWRERLKKEVN